MKTRVTVATLLALLVTLPVGAQQEKGPIEVPLRVLGGRLVVPVDAGVGHPLDFVLSTGSAVTVLSETTAQQLGDSPQLTLAGLPVPMEGFAIVADDRLAVEGAMIGGMISANMLNQFDVLVDVPNERLLLKTPGREVSWDGVELSEPLRVRVLHAIVLSFDVSVNGHPYPATMDLSSPRVVATSGVQADTGIAAEEEVTLTVGSSDLPGIPLEVQDLDILRRWDPDSVGFVLLGAPITYDCVLSISWAHRELRTCTR